MSNSDNLIGDIFTGISIGISQSIKRVVQGMYFSSCFTSPFLESTVSVFNPPPFFVCLNNLGGGGGGGGVRRNVPLLSELYNRSTFGT